MTDAVAVGSRHELTIMAITSEGAGLGRLSDGRVVFAQRTVPGDLALVEIASIRPRWARANLLTLQSHGPDRREPVCPHYDRCGGCTMQHMEYDTALAWKGRFVMDALTRIGRRSPPPATIHPSPSQTQYRNRITFTVVRSGSGRITAGFHRLDEPGTIEDVDARCVLPEPVISEVWGQLRSCWGPGGARLPGGPRLRLTLRSIAERDVLMLVEGGDDDGDPEGLISDIPQLSSIWSQPQGADDRPVLLAGEQDLMEQWYGEDTMVRPAAFLQVNRGAAKMLHEHVLAQCMPATEKRVIDAYCGSGAVGRNLAREGATVTGIDADPEAGQMHGSDTIAGFRMLTGRVEDLIVGSLPADLVVLNPPRAGVRPPVIEALQKNPPARVVYVSCDPATLARDVRRLGPTYQISQIHVFDLFPQTSRVEAVLALDRH